MKTHGNYDYKALASIKDGNSIWGFILNKQDAGMVNCMDIGQVSQLLSRGKRLDTIAIDNSGNLYPITPGNNKRAASIVNKRVKNMRDFVNYDYVFTLEQVKKANESPEAGYVAGAVASIMPSKDNEALVMFSLLSGNVYDIHNIREAVMRLKEKYPDIDNGGKCYGTFGEFMILNMRLSVLKEFITMTGKKLASPADTQIHWNMNCFNNMEDRVAFTISAMPFGSLLANRAAKAMGSMIADVKHTLESSNN